MGNKYTYEELYEVIKVQDQRIKELERRVQKIQDVIDDNAPDWNID